jgi:hypothetical protein
MPALAKPRGTVFLAAVLIFGIVWLIAVADARCDLTAELTTAPRKGVDTFTCLRAMTCVAKTPGCWWVGTRGGLVRLDEKTLAVQRVYSPVDGLAGNWIWSLAADGDALWVGALGGVSRLDVNSGEVRTFRSEGLRWSFDFDREAHCVWALEGQSVLAIDKDSNRAKTYRLPPRTLNVVRDGRILWGASHGADGSEIVRLDTATSETTTRSGFNRQAGIPTLIVAKDSIWALMSASGLRQGHFLYRIDKKTLDVEAQGAATGLPIECVQEVAAAGSDVWARTTGDYNNKAHVGVGGQLCRYNAADRRWEVLPSITGIKHDEPTCLGVLGGDLWVAARSYETMSNAVIGWMKAPIEGDWPDVKALSVSRWDAVAKKWISFLIPRDTNYDCINALGLKGRRLWFLVERRVRQQPDDDTPSYGMPRTCTIAGYANVDRSEAMKSPKEAPDSFDVVLFDKSPMPPPDLNQAGPGSQQDLLVDDAGAWVRCHGSCMSSNWGWMQVGEELWRLTDKRTCTKLVFPHTLPETRGMRLFSVDGKTMVSCCGGWNLRFDPEGRKWEKSGIPSPWTATGIVKDSRGVWWASALIGRVHLPADADRNDDDRKPLQAGLFRSRDGVTWELPTVAPWTWQQNDVDERVDFVPLSGIKRTPRDVVLSGLTSAERLPPPPGARRVALSKLGEGVVCVEGDGKRLWVGTLGEGVLRLENNRWHRLWPKSAETTAAGSWSIIPRAPQDTVTSMALDGDSLWIATMAHLNRYSISGGSIETIDGKLVGFEPVANVSGMESPSFLEYGPVVAKAAGRIWFSPPWCLGTMVSGTYYLADDHRAWKCAIPDAHGRCFAASGKVVWIGTPNGLWRYDTKQEKSTRLTTRDGLVADDVTAVAVDASYIWVGTPYGISRLDRALFDR